MLLQQRQKAGQSVDQDILAFMSMKAKSDLITEAHLRTAINASYIACAKAPLPHHTNMTRFTLRH